MSIVTITDGMFGCTEALGREVGFILGYRYICQEDLLKQLQRFCRFDGIPFDVLEVNPPWWKRFLESTRFYEIGLRAALCEIADCDKFVYQGLVGQELLPPIRHVVRILVTFPIEYRVRQVAQAKGLSSEAARDWLAKMDEITDRRVKAIFGVGWLDSRRYDVALNVSNLSLKATFDLIVEAARQVEFQATDESKDKFQDFLLEGRIRGALLAERSTRNTDVKLEVTNGLVHVSGFVPLLEFDYKNEIIGIIKSVSGVKKVTEDVQQLPVDDSFPTNGP
jgi:Cytidylate kinase-like family/BON domain